MIKTLSTALLAGLLFSPAIGAEAMLARHPAPSPDGREIAFSWQGDIWVVAAQGGRARRLTANPADERHPIWSRDGSRIAFSSNRHGNDDVFVVSLTGDAPPQRLSFACYADQPEDFTPDGKAVLFSSRRDESFRRPPSLYRVPLKGGTPALEQAALGRHARFSPDGQHLAFVRGETKIFRRGYRGSANREIWSRDPEGSYRQLTHFDGDDDFPNWVGNDGLLFLSSRNGRKNLFLSTLGSDAPRALTFFDDSAARFPRVSANGRLVAFEYQDAIYTLQLPDGKPERLVIELPPDRLRAEVERKRESTGASELVVRSDGKLAAFVVHGEIFVTAIRSKEDQQIAPSPTVRVTRNAARDAQPCWTTDGKRLVFTSEINGATGLYAAHPATGEKPEDWLQAFDFEIEVLIDDPASHESRARFSPDGKHLAFQRDKGQLVVAAADGSSPHVVFDSWNLGDFSWSPDGRWLAYNANDIEYNSEVYIVSAEGGTPYNLSRHPDNDSNARWSADGRRLIWLSKRHANTMDLWGVWLTREDEERSPEGWLALWSAQKGETPKKNSANIKPDSDGKNQRKRKKNSDKTAATEDKKALPKLRIDFDGLWERTRSLTALDGDEGPALFVEEGKKILFTAQLAGERDLYAVRWDGSDLERLTTGGKAPVMLQLDKKGKTVYFLSQGKISRVSLAGKPGDPIPFEARYEIDRRAEREIVLHEGWSALNTFFYDPDFHGIDWAAQREKYLPWAREASSDADFADVMNLMLGELNASHMGYYRGGRRPADQADHTGMIGALFDPEADGPGLAIREVLVGSPAARKDVALVPGEHLLAVGGRMLSPTTNVYELFVATEGVRTPMRVRGLDGKERRVTVVPISTSAQAQLRYRTWVKQRRALVDKLSGGRLGYLHIQSMSIPPFELFERDLFAAAHGKEGLLIDVRSNGGGWTTDYLMAVLNVRRHAFTVPRDADGTSRAYPQNRLPLAAWTRPAATLCDEASYSNAEIFSRAFKNLKRGLLIGTSTFGAVISTGGMQTLDGALVRLPTRGWYDGISGENQENHGVVPDIIVSRPPEQDTSICDDDQLATAVRALLASLPSDPRSKTW